MKLKLFSSIVLRSFFIGIGSFFVFFLISTSQAHAQVDNRNRDFSHSVTVEYITKQDRSGDVIFSFTTTNKVNNDYLDNFSLNIPFQPTSYDTTISPTRVDIREVRMAENATNFVAEIDILDPVYGEGQQFDWKIKFNFPSFVQRHGIQNAIIIPTLDSNNLDIQYKSRVKVHNSFGGVSIVHNNYKITKVDDFYVIDLEKEKKEKGITNYVILLGNKQEFNIEISRLSDREQVLFPIDDNTQETIYFNFPETDYYDDLASDDSDESGEENYGEISYEFLPKDTVIEGLIRLTKSYDRLYFNRLEKVEHRKVLDQLGAEVSDNNRAKPRKTLATEFVYLLKNQVSLGDVFSSSLSRIDINSKTNFGYNPIELNKLLREYLALYKIETRAVLGYVHPLNILGSEDGILRRHVWTEFWDGEKWVTVDPVWVITSNGNDYIDKNFFNHIKFSYYEDEKEFLQKVDLMNALSLRVTEQPSNAQAKLDVQLYVYSDTDTDKEVNLVIKNTSNRPIKIGGIVPSFISDNSNVEFNKEIIELNKYLLPNQKVSESISIKYNLVFKDIAENLNFKILYSGLDVIDEFKDKSFNHIVNIQSNLPMYLINVYLVVVSICTAIVMFFTSKIK